MIDGLGHMISSFILNERYKIAHAKLVHKQKVQKAKELRKKMLSVSPQRLVTLQSEFISCLKNMRDKPILAMV